jgi:hypothetical protein
MRVELIVSFKIITVDECRAIIIRFWIIIVDEGRANHLVQDNLFDESKANHQVEDNHCWSG